MTTICLRRPRHLANASALKRLTGRVCNNCTILHYVTKAAVITSPYGRLALLTRYRIVPCSAANEIVVWLSQYKPNLQWLETANQSLTTKEAQLRLLTLAIHQWQRYFERNILSMPAQIEYWPIMIKNKCHCGTWIKRARQDSLFSDAWLTEFEHVHHEIHQIANDLLLKYQNDKHEEARSGLTQLRTRFDKMDRLISSEITG